MLLQCSADLCSFARTAIACLFAAYIALLSLSSSLYRSRALSLSLSHTLTLSCARTRSQVYFEFISTNVGAVIGDTSEKQRRILMALLIPVLGSLALIRNMKTLAPLSAIANISMATGLAVIVYFSIYHMVSLPSAERGNGTHHGNHSQNHTLRPPGIAPEARSMAIPDGGAKLPLFIGVVIYSFEGCGAILPIENVLAKPEQFGSLCTAVFATFFSIYLLIGSVGFLSFEFDDPTLKENDKGSISAVISHYYAETPGKDGAVLDIVNILLAFAVALTYPVQFFAAIEVLEHKVGLSDHPAHAAQAQLTGVPRSRKRWMKQVGFRLLVVLATFAVAVLVPKLGPIIALFGALFGGTIELILPPALYLLSNVGAGKKPTLAITWTLLVVGLGAVLIGSYSAAKELSEPPTNHSASASLWSVADRPIDDAEDFGPGTYLK